VIYLVLLSFYLCVSFGLQIKVLCRIVLWQISIFVTYPLRICSVFISDDFRFYIRFRDFRFFFNSDKMEACFRPFPLYFQL
jgi:hypothetical protein